MKKKKSREELSRSDSHTANMGDDPDKSALPSQLYYTTWGRCGALLTLTTTYRSLVGSVIENIAFVPRVNV